MQQGILNLASILEFFSLLFGSDMLHNVWGEEKGEFSHCCKVFFWSSDLHLFYHEFNIIIWLKRFSFNISSSLIGSLAFLHFFCNCIVQLNRVWVTFHYIQMFHRHYQLNYLDYMQFKPIIDRSACVVSLWDEFLIFLSSSKCNTCDYNFSLIFLFIRRIEV